MLLLLSLIFAAFSQNDAILECLNDQGNRKFANIRDCARSTEPVLSFANYQNLNRCLNYASSKNALAVNFSPLEAAQFRGESFKSTCQVLACPEIVESNLVNDSAYDYYTFYRNLTDDSTCVKSTGVYKLVQEKTNYTKAVQICQSFNGDLAQVQTEALTNSLASLLLNSIRNWTKLAFVGMDDTPKRGNFVTSFGNRLACYRYRAWAPGHPRLARRRRSCVVLDADKTWKVTSCGTRMPFLCEIKPSAPFTMKIPLDCSKITDVGKKKRCEKKKILVREDMCRLV